MNVADGKYVYRGRKIRLLPTKEQEELFWKSAGVARWAYNYFLSVNEEKYREWLNNGKKGDNFVSEMDVRKYINNVLKKTTHTWLKEVGSNVMKQAVKDANTGLQRFFKKIAGKPKFRNRKRSKISFYVNYESLIKTHNGFRGEKIGYVKTKTPLPKLPNGEKYLTPYVTYDGKYWFLSVVYRVKVDDIELTSNSLGIDLGIKELAVVSNQTGSNVKVYKNINKSMAMKKLRKRLVREQRKMARKMLSNIAGYKVNNRPIWKRNLSECKNFEKQKRKVNCIYRKMTNIRNNYLHQVTTEIVKTKPFQIVMEDLCVRNMVKNKYIAKAITEQSFFDFKKKIKYKSEMYGIKVIEADRWYASSKKCSRCGHIKKDLKLSDRTYICPECGMKIDRDLNAAINLANYKIA